MKTNLKYLFLVLTGLGFSSCDNHLDKVPIDQIGAEQFFNNGVNAQSAVTGAYRTLESSYYYGQALILIPEFAAGHIRHYLSFPEFLEYTENRIRVDNPWSLNIWTASYTTINAVNNIIDRVPGIETDITEELRQQLMGEAKFIRALVYFNLVRSWGDVPLVLSPTQSSQTAGLQVSRRPAADVYAQVVADLQDAVTSLPEAYGTPEQTKGRATAWAAKALLAKVYLYQENYAQAAQLAEEVIESGRFSLESDYSTIWVNENSNEAIFELQFNEQATNALVGVSNPVGATQFYASDLAYRLFEPTDRRRNFAINTVVDNGDTTFYIGKYRNVSPPTQNVPVLRLAELYLIHAEATARAAGSVSTAAYQSYKTVRDRAGLTTPAAATFTTVARFVEAIQQEKRLEMIFEAETWYDYVRTDLALEELMQVPNANFYLFPIPQGERDLNPNLTQNTGY